MMYVEKFNQAASRTSPTSQMTCCSSISYYSRGKIRLVQQRMIHYIKSWEGWSTSLVLTSSGLRGNPFSQTFPPNDPTIK